MSTNPPPFPAFSPGLLSLIPLLYVAWADRVLDPKEVKLLERKAAELPFLKDSDRAQLQTWCDPSKPPSRELFQHWRILIREQSAQLPTQDRQSLVDLGLEMAKRSATKQEGVYWTEASTRAALESLEEALDLVHIETYLSLKAKPHQEIFPPSFDVGTLQTILDAFAPNTRKELRKLLCTDSFSFQTIREKEAYRDLVLAWCKELAKTGYGALAYPTEHGGNNDMAAYSTAFEMLGYHDLSLAVKFGVQFGLFGGSIHALGTAYHHEKYLAKIGTLELPGCFAMTETGHGSNVRNLETTATYDMEHQEFIIHSPEEEAGKEYIGNALHGRMATVFAQLIVKGKNHGVHAILVPLRNEQHQLLPGIRIEDNGYKLGLNGVDNGRIWFDQVRVPRENLLNQFGDVSPEGNYSSPIENPSRRFFTMLGTLVGGRVCVPRAGLSATKKGLAIAIKYALKRRQFGPANHLPETLLLDYPSHQRRLMPLLAKTYALHFALIYLSDRFVNRSDADIREIETLAAGLKSYATWHTTDTLQVCREACGGKGYLHENRFADLKADTDIFTTFEGDNTVLMLLVARGLLSAFRQEFHEEGTLGVLRYLSGRITTSITERNPIIIRSTDRNHLLDSQFHLNAFKYREERLLYSVGQRLRGKIKGGMNAHLAYLDCQSHLLALAEAYAERITLEQFIKAVEKTEVPAVQATLKMLCDLYALHTIEKHKGWYLEANYMEGVKTKAIRRLVDELCARTRQEANGLVDAFGIPAQLLGAEILT